MTMFATVSVTLQRLEFACDAHCDDVVLMVQLNGSELAYDTHDIIH